MKSAKYEAANDEIALLLKEWERVVDAFSKSEDVVDNPHVRNSLRGYFEYAARDCALAFTRILDELTGKEVEERETFNVYYESLKYWRKSIDSMVAIDRETSRKERRR